MCGQGHARTGMEHKHGFSMYSAYTLQYINNAAEPSAETKGFVGGFMEQQIGAHVSLFLAELRIESL